MANQPVEVEIREPGHSSGKPRSGMSAEQIYAVGDQPQTDNRSWLHRNAFLLCFLFGWLLFPFWWGAAICGIKKRKSLKGSEKAAWYGCVALSLAGIIIFLIFIIWYGADPQGARRALTSFYTWDESSPNSSTGSDTAMAQFTLKYKGSCNDTTYDALLSSVNNTFMTGTAADENLLVVKGAPCVSQDSTAGRHLLELVSTYQVLLKVKTGASDDAKLALAARIEQLSTGGKTPGWCGSFCTDHESDVVGSDANEFGYKECSKAGTDGKAYVCQSGTLIGDNLALDGKVTDAFCCTNCNSVCPTAAAVREGVKLAANQDPTFELCCNPCFNLTCSLGAVSPAPTLDASTQPTEDVCCNQAPVVAPSVSMELPLPDCNETTAAALASGTQAQMIQNQEQGAGSTLSVKGECVAETTSSSSRRLADAETPKNKVKLTITIAGPKTHAEMQEATKVFVKAFGFDVADNATTDDLVAQLQSLKKPNSTGAESAMSTLVTKISKACQDAGLTVNVTTDSIQQGFQAIKVTCLCPGLPSVANVVFPTSCSNSKVGDPCFGACKAGVGMMASICGIDGKWGAATGECLASATKKSCTESPAAVLHATWPSSNCSGKDSCQASCDMGYSGQPTATCDPLTGAWSKPVGGCTPVKCPPLKDDATFTWPKQCLFNRQDFVCNATCNDGTYGEAPSALCTLQASGNSAEWNVSSLFNTAEGCYAPTTCDRFDSSGVICSKSKSVLLTNHTCVNPNAYLEVGVDMSKCTVDNCCRAPKTCGEDFSGSCNSTTERLYESRECEDNNHPACDAKHCCIPDQKCKDVSYMNCPAHQLLLADQPCGDDLGANKSCTPTDCCVARPQYPVNATCGDLDGNKTARAFTDDNCGAGRKYNTSAANVTVFELITEEAAGVCCKDIVVLTLRQTPAPADILIGSKFNLTITVKNTGYQNAANVTVSQELPAGMAYNGSTPAGCNITGLSLVCGPIDTLTAQGDGVSYTVPVHVSISGILQVAATATGKGASDAATYPAAPLSTPLAVKLTCAHYTEKGEQFACPSLYLYNAAAAGVDVSGVNGTLARDRCCSPSCSALSYACSESDSMVLKTNANVTACPDGECTDQLCCDLTCVTYANNCSTGWLPNDELTIVCPSGVCNDATCCHKTCDSYQCSTNYTAKALSTFTTCPGNSCNDTICCDLSCVSHTCSNTSLVRLGNPESKPCTDSNCSDAVCCVAPGTCASYSCTDQYYLPTISEDVKARQCAGNGCNATTCCDQTCAIFSCTGNYKNRTIDMAKQTSCVGGCTESDCCDPKMSNIAVVQSIAPEHGILVGDNLTITITVSNNGEIEGNATTTEELPQGLQYVGALPTGCKVDDQSQKLTCGPANVPVGSITLYNLTAKATKAATYHVTARAEVGLNDLPGNDDFMSTIAVGQTCQHYDSHGPFPCGDKYKFNSANANISEAVNKTTCCIEEYPNVALTQTISHASAAGNVLIGDDVTITVTLNNTGDYKAVNAEVTHTLPPSFTFVAASISGCVPQDNTVVCTISSIASNDSESYTLTATAGANGQQTVESSVSVAENRNTDVSKTNTITVDHTCHQFNPDKSQFKCPANYEIDQAQVNNTGPDKDTCCNELYPDVTISEETVPANGIVTIGDNIKITVTLVNQGNGSATNATLSQTLSAGLQYVIDTEGCVHNASSASATCTMDSISANGTVSYEFTVKAMNEASLVATSSVSSLDADGKKTSNGPVLSEVYVHRTCSQYSNDKTAYSCPEMYSTKPGSSGTIVSEANPKINTTTACCTELFPNLVLTPSATTVNKLIGDDVTLTATVKNVGDYKAVNMALVLTVPDGLHLVGADPTAGTVCNITTLTCTTETLEKIETATYTIIVKAVTPGIHNMTMEVTAAGDINLDNQVPQTVSVNVGQTCGQYDSDKNHFNCTAIDKYTYNTSSATNTNLNKTVCCTELFPDLVLPQPTDPVPILIGDNVTLTASVKNVGGYKAVNTTLALTVPAGLQPVDASATAGTVCDLVALTCTTATIAVNETVNYTITAKAVTAGSHNVAINATSAGDSNPDNNVPQTVTVAVGRTCAQYNSDGSHYPCTDKYTYNTSSATNENPSVTACCTELFPDLELTQSTDAANNTMLIGGNVTLTVTVKNVGGYKAANTNMTLTKSSALELVGASTTAGEDCNTTALTCSKVSLANGSDVTYTFTFKATAAGSYNVTSTVATDGDSNTANNAPQTATIVVGRTCGQNDKDMHQYSCPTNYRFNQNSVNNTSPSDATCCTPTCAGYDVCTSANMTLKTDLSNIVCTGGGCDDAICCTASCQSYDCAAVNLAWINAASTTSCEDCTQTACCVPEVAQNCTAYDCRGHGKLWKDDIGIVCNGAGNLDCSQTRCCSTTDVYAAGATCSDTDVVTADAQQYVCGGGFTDEPTAAGFDLSTVRTAAEAKASCCTAELP